MDSTSIRDVTTDALRYWEPRRILYNLLLAAIVFGYFGKAWPASRETLSVNGFLGLFLLAVLANVAYCAAYAVDFFVQLSNFRERRNYWRLLVLIVGFTFAAVLTRFFALGMFHTNA